ADARHDWTAWLDQHGPALVLLARQWVPSTADAEDVVQEGFVRFWRSRGRAVDPTAYLFACVKHCALDWLRGRGPEGPRGRVLARREGVRLFAGSLEQAER